MSRGIEQLLNQKNDDVERQRLEMYSSLARAVIESGGNVPSIMELISQGMTVYELIDMLGQNGVRFVHKGDKND